MAMYFEDFEVGQEWETPGRTVTEADVATFAGLSGDYNPLHTNEEFAKKTPYGTRIAHGPLVYAMAMGLVNRLGLTEGTSLGFLELDQLRFLRPVKLGDTITVRIRVTETIPSSKGGRGVLKRKVMILNQHGEPVQEAIMVTMAMGRPVATAS